MKHLQLFLAALVLAASGMANAVPVIKMNAGDSNASALTAPGFQRTPDNAELVRVTEGVTATRKPPAFSTDPGTSQGSAGSFVAAVATEHGLPVAPAKASANSKTPGDQPASTHSPLTDPETWLLLLFGIGFVALQSGRRGSTVNANKLQ
ncbi:hypothetical protein [Actimicrobium antarcticum]|uniref:PEP-CTERM protein-sorting domain-containing protein n=1 Tax=Actimicrobium antarcticum TaxID=1051899 RepID=A0ABP7T4D0_9BURK